MQDRFKFRAKLKDMDKWIYGAYLKMLPYQPYPVGNVKPLKTEYKHLIIIEGSADWGMPRGIAAYEVIPETVGQCTGLKDKNGKLIYENDILYENWINDVFPKGKYWIVKWNNNQAQFYIELINKTGNSLTDTWHLARHNLDYEVVGNIFENEELVK